MLNRIRLVSGLVLLAYVVPHLINHALGIVSLAAMEAGLPWTIAPWRTLPGTLLLAGAAIAHVVSALWSLLARHSLRGMPRWQVLQVAFGLLIPLILAAHVFGTRGTFEAFATRGSYESELLILWVLAPHYAWVQVLLLAIVWIHSCIGLHGWLRLKSWYARRQPLALALAVLVPALAIAGYVARGMDVRTAATAPAYVASVVEQARLPANGRAWVESRWHGTILVTLIIYGGLFAWRGLRLARVRDGYRLGYGGVALVARGGSTVLDALRAAAIPHASVCGGRGRCSTCRVHVEAGAAELPPPGADELRVLQRIAAPASVRLACQLRPRGDLAVTPLLSAGAGPGDACDRAELQRSEERSVCVMFADLRGFTRLAESRLPYDVVFVLNRFRATMARAIADSGGVVNEFVGDGIMALFGLEADAQLACRQAVQAAHRMVEALAELNATLAADLDAPLRIGIGIHVGPVIVGEMGSAAVKGITAVGDVVNTASRLEELTKTYSATVVVSDDVAQAAGVAAVRQRHTVGIRGRAEALGISVLETGTLA